MQELIDKLKEKVGLTEDQATNAIGAIKDFVKEKFPMLEGAVENMFGAKPDATASGDSASTTASDFIKDATGKAEDAFDSIKGKISGLFSDNK
jgi:hypothetical protein